MGGRRASLRNTCQGVAPVCAKVLRKEALGCGRGEGASSVEAQSRRCWGWASRARPVGHGEQLGLYPE